MIPGGAGFVFIPFLDERIAGCVRDGVPPRVERCLFMKERGYMRFFERGLIAIVRTYVIVYAFWKRKPRRLSG